MEKSYLEIINKRKQIEIANIKKCNQITKQYGLVLSDYQISNILERRKEVLKETGRVELREGIIDKIIKEFCDSPYINQENYAETLYELIEIFYEYKNETMDLMTDDELISFMKKSFDGICQGNLEYLSGTVMYKMRENLLKGKPLDYLEEAYYNEMLTNDDMVNLQMQMLQLLDEKVYKYTGNDTTSIRKEVMDDILNSNSYTISIYLKTFRNPDEALKEIQEKGLKIAYQEGRKKIDRMLNIIRLMYIKVKQNKLNIENDTYNDTIIAGIQGFLKIYDSDFKSQDIKITADYPLYNNLIGKLDGVEFIKEYLNSIYLENTFCKKFSEEKIKYLLYGYSHDYKELIINIFEIVLLETIGCKLAKRNIRDLSISIDELNDIYEMFKHKEKIEIKQKIYETYQEMSNELLLDNEQLQNYIEKNLSCIVEMIINGVEQNILDKVFITQKFITN